MGQQTSPPLTKPTTPSPQTSQDNAQTPPPGTTVTSSSGGGGSKMNIILIILGILALITVGAVGYLYFTNQNLVGGKQEEAVVTVPTNTPTPIPEDTFEILNGSIYRVTGTGDEILLVDKSDYEDTGITGFVEVSVSPDKSQLCFYSLPPALDPALYTSDVDGQNVSMVSDRKTNCTWSPDSKMIVYTDDAPGNSASDIYGYFLEEGAELNYTEDTQPTSSNEVIVYSIGSWDTDGTILSCTYEKINTVEDTTTNGSCEIDISTGQFTDLSETTETQTSTGSGAFESDFSSGGSTE
jgi:hypothetical protein